MSPRWEIHPRDSDLGRTFDPISLWSELTLVERYPEPHTWVLEGPASALSVFTPGMGCILDRIDGDTTTQVASGQVRSIDRKMEADGTTGRIADTITLGFVSDREEISKRLAFPVPSKVLTSTPSTFSAAHDVETGAVETVLLKYIADNLGPAALVANRRMASLVMPTTQGRGGSTTVSARMDNLGTLVADLSEAGGLLVDVVHDESTGAPRLLLTVDAVRDLSANVRFGPADTAATGAISSWAYQLEAPDLTRAVVFSANELDARKAAQFVDTAAESLWGRAREVLVDQRQTDDTAEITRAGTEALEEGATPVTVEFTVVDGPDVKYRRDYRVGDRVGVEIPGLPEAVSDNVVREVVTTVKPNEAEEIRVTVGTPGATARSTKQAVRMARALREINLLKRSL